MASLTLSHVSKYYDKVKALDDVTLEIKDREFFIILGPSGSGKTTTIRLAAGLETPTSGHIYLDDMEITDFPPKDRDVAMVFQSYALYPFMTVRENLAFPLKVRKLSKTDIENRVEETARLLQISDLLDRKPGEISGGQRQRVALGRAIIRDAKVFLMDEPLSNLDAKLRSSMRVELKSLQRKLGITVVYVTHDQLEAMTLGDRISVIHHGKVIQEGAPEAVFNRPKNLFVAGFLGDPSMNFIDGTVVKESDKIYVKIGSKYEFQPDNSEHLVNYLDKEITVGIRPEDMEFDTNEGIEGEIILARILGRIIQYSVKIIDSDQIITKLDHNLDSILKEGTRIKLKPYIDRICLYDKENTEIID